MFFPCFPVNLVSVRRFQGLAFLAEEGGSTAPHVIVPKDNNERKGEKKLRSKKMKMRIKKKSVRRIQERKAVKWRRTFAHVALFFPSLQFPEARAKPNPSLLFTPLLIAIAHLCQTTQCLQHQSFFLRKEKDEECRGERTELWHFSSFDVDAIQVLQL